MKRLLCAFGLFILFSNTSAFAQGDPYFLANPALSPDDQTVVFSFDGDLWKVASTGGSASRITAMPGDEINPRISPDGKWIAFSSNQFGNYDVYIMALSGGEVKQLTFNDAADELDSWSWDSKFLYFTSGRYNSYSSYKVSVTGGTAVRLFNSYFNTTHNVAEAPDGELFFNDTWESKSFANRKRYKGAYNPDIQSYNPKTKTYKQYTDYRGKDFWATIDKKGNVYFVSDEANDELNLYTFISGRKTKLTSFESPVRRPFVSASGNKIVFEKDYQLYIYDVASKKTDKISINVSRNNVLEKTQEFDVRGNISAFDLSPDGNKLAFVSRGELFVSDAEGKYIRKMERSGAFGLADERVLEVKWLSDNLTLLFNQTYKGYQNWFTLLADGKGSMKQLTKDNRNNRDIAFNKVRTSAVYLSGRDEVRLLDLKSLDSKVIVKDEIWAFQNSTPSFSSNGEYVLFTAYRNFEQDIFVHHIKDNKTINLTNTGVTESSPSWSPDGKYIFFNSMRTKPNYPFGPQNARVYRMALDDYDQPYRSDKFDDLFKPKKVEKTDNTPAVKNPVDKKATKKPGVKDSLAKPAAKAVKPADMITINVQNIMDRVEQVSPSFGTQYGTAVFAKGEKTYVFYYSDHEGGSPALYRTIIEPFENNKTEKVVDGAADIIEVGDRYYGLSRGIINKYNIDYNRLEPLNIGFKFNRNLSGEFNQMFYETWAGMEENYYDEQFHGVDWLKIQQKYAGYLKYVTSRTDLRILLNDMLGELNSSHQGFNSQGAEERKNLNYTTNQTGIVFSNSEPFKVDYVVAKSNGTHSGVDINKGDILMAVNGIKVDPSIDRDYYFTSPSLDQEISLTFSRAGKSIITKVHPQSSGALKGNLYDEWITGNRSHVKELSNDRIAYSYMKNMSGGELESFLLDMVAQENNKEAVILDLRYNTGGNVHDEVLKFLSQRPYLQWKYRGGKLSPQSNFAPAAKPIVLLINEQSLSDAEMTAAGFKALKLGKIIGTESYRWIIFTSAKGLVDGSSYRLPSWGCYTLEGKDLEKEGVSPDIFVKTTFMDRLQGKDPQIERAVAEILKDLKK